MKYIKYIGLIIFTVVIISFCGVLVFKNSKRYPLEKDNSEVIKSSLVSRRSKSRSRCPRIDRYALKNGRVRNRGRVVKFSCNNGFVMLGSRFATCVRGTWSRDLPTCIAQDCDPIDPPRYGHLIKRFNGALLTIKCNPGYKLTTSYHMIYCDEMDWNSTMPECIPQSKTPPIKCDFESEDMCGWSHDLKAHFSWSRHSYTTPSGHVGTGPSFDHTKGKDGHNGHYMYIESSSPRKVNDTARLFSPVFPPNYSATYQCFTFWYHMLGTTTGSLKVYIKEESKVHINELKPNWEKHGEQGNVWIQGAVNIRSFSENFQIVIEGVRGSSYVSDSAIDDISLINSECSKAITTSTPRVTTPRPLPSLTSCRYRCGHRPPASRIIRVTAPTTSPKNSSSYSNITAPGIHDLTCYCDDHCIDTNTCCSNYIELCRPDLATSSTNGVSTTTDTYTSENIKTNKSETTMKDMKSIPIENATKIVSSIFPETRVSTSSYTEVYTQKLQSNSTEMFTVSNSTVDLSTISSVTKGNTKSFPGITNISLVTEKPVSSAAIATDVASDRTAATRSTKVSLSSRSDSTIKHTDIVTTYPSNTTSSDLSDVNVTLASSNTPMVSTSDEKLLTLHSTSSSPKPPATSDLITNVETQTDEMATTNFKEDTNKSSSSMTSRLSSDVTSNPTGSNFTVEKTVTGDRTFKPITNVTRRTESTRSSTTAAIITETKSTAAKMPTTTSATEITIILTTTTPTTTASTTKTTPTTTTSTITTTTTPTTSTSTTKMTPTTTTPTITTTTTSTTTASTAKMTPTTTTSTIATTTKPITTTSTPTTTTSTTRTTPTTTTSTITTKTSTVTFTTPTTTSQKISTKTIFRPRTTLGAIIIKKSTERTSYTSAIETSRSGKSTSTESTTENLNNVTEKDSELQKGINSTILAIILVATFVTISIIVIALLVIKKRQKKLNISDDSELRHLQDCEIIEYM